MKFVKIYSIIFQLIQFTLLPLLIWQGKSVRKKVLKLPEATGKRFGTVGKGKNLKILFIGDSSACGVGVKNIEQSLSGGLIKNLKNKYKCTWKIIAKSGVNTNQLIDLITIKKDETFSIVIISVGMNDITSVSSLKLWSANLKKLESILLKKFSINYYIYSGMPPVHKLYIIPIPLRYFLSLKALLFDNYLRSKCSNLYKFEYININKLSSKKDMVATDGFHPSENFYTIWSNKIAQKIKLVK